MRAHGWDDGVETMNSGQIGGTLKERERSHPTNKSIKTICDKRFQKTEYELQILACARFRVFHMSWLIN